MRSVGVYGCVCVEIQGKESVPEEFACIFTSVMEFPLYLAYFNKAWDVLLVDVFVFQGLGLP